MVRQTTKVIILEVFGVLSLCLMAAAGVLAFMLASGPVELGMFRDDVERALTKARDGRSVAVERVTLQWSPAKRSVFIVANNVSLKDAQNKEAGFVTKADLTIDAGSAVLGKIEVISASIDEGWIHVQNTAPNMWTVAGDPLPEIKSGPLPQTPEEWLQRVNTVLFDLLSAVEEQSSARDLEALEFSDLDLRILAPNGGQVGLIKGAKGKLESGVGALSVILEGNGEGTLLPAELKARVEISENYTNLEGDLSIGILPLGEMLSAVGLPGIEGSSLVVDTEFGASLRRETGLEDVRLTLVSTEGDIPINALSNSITKLEANLVYQPKADTISIERLNAAFGRSTTQLTGTFKNVLAKNALRRIDLNGKDTTLDLTPYFPEVWQIDSLSLGADVSDDFSVFVIDLAEIQIGDMSARASGELDLTVEAQEGEIPLTLNLSAEAFGSIDKETVLRFWPETLGDGGRRFVVSQVNGATLSEITARLNLKPDSRAEGYLRDEDLEVSFAFKNGNVRFMPDMPPVTEAIGVGSLKGNSFSIKMTSGMFDDWTMQMTEVDFPQLNPRGADFTVKAIGSGPAVSVMRNLSNSNLKLQERTGFDPERIGGTARASFFMSRPALDDVPYEDVTLNVRGEITNGSLKDTVGELDLERGRVDVDMTQDRLILTGHGDLGTSPVQFTFRQAIGEDVEGEPADLSATAIVTPDFLNAFGVTGRAYLSGEVPVEVQGKVSGRGLGEASFAFDLRDARIDLSELGYTKPKGEIAKATLTYDGGATEQASTLKIESEKAKLDGNIRLAPDGRLQSLNLRRLFLKDTADVAGQLRRSETGGFVVSLTGAYLDVSSVLGNLTALGGSGSQTEFDLKLDANVERLRLRRELELTGALLSVVAKPGFVERARASGKASGGVSVEAELSTSARGAPASISIKSSDAGFLAKAFLGLDFMTGGVLDVTGTLATQSQPAKLRARITDTRLKDAPFFTQILSLASLRGLTDTLAGEGVLFTRIEAPITIGGGRYVIDGARASGPALGLTANGWVGTNGQGIELDGVLVPSFGVNSMLGGVPIIGDLIVGREGEGIFSITYSVRGTLEKAQVAVNPLSAVTPGILRRIFENPSDTTIPQGLPVDPNLKPPSEKLPDLPDEQVLAPTPGSGG